MPRRQPARWPRSGRPALGDAPLPQAFDCRRYGRGDRRPQSGSADALAASAAAVASRNGRAYLLERAWELRSGGYTASAPPRIGDALLRELPLDVFFEAVSARLIPERVVDVHKSVVFEVADEGRRYALTARREIAELSISDALPGTPEPLATVTVDGLTWWRLALQIDGATGALARGEQKIAGNRIGLLRFIERVERRL